ncbi:MAG TPA: hypothetical protein VHA33_25700 [Candidatus Angelobacter sp.]|nr:hypothetical protein [Candidatus Angelobacter sp.]
MIKKETARQDRLLGWIGFVFQLFLFAPEHGGMGHECLGNSSARANRSFRFWFHRPGKFTYLLCIERHCNAIQRAFRGCLSCTIGSAGWIFKGIAAATPTAATTAAAASTAGAGWIGRSTKARADPLTAFALPF